MAIIPLSAFKVVVGVLVTVGLLGSLAFAVKSRPHAQAAAPEDWAVVRQRWAAMPFGEYRLRVEQTGKQAPIFQASGQWDAKRHRVRTTLVLPGGKAETLALEDGRLFDLDAARKTIVEIVTPPPASDQMDCPLLQSLRRGDLSAVQQLALDPLSTAAFFSLSTPQSSTRQGESDVYQWQAEDGTPPSFRFQLWVRRTDELPTRFVCEYPHAGQSLVYTYDVRPLTAAPALTPIPTDGLKHSTQRPKDPLSWQVVFAQTPYSQAQVSLAQTMMQATMPSQTQGGLGSKSDEGSGQVEGSRNPVTGEVDGWAADPRTRRMLSLAALRRRSIIPVLSLPVGWGTPSLIQQQVPETPSSARDELDSTRLVFDDTGNGLRWSVETSNDSSPPAGGTTHETIRENAGSERVETIQGRQVALLDGMGSSYLYAVWYEPDLQEQVNITMAGTDTKRLRRLATELIEANLSAKKP